MGSMAENEPTRRFLTIEQVAQELNVGEPLVRAMLKAGELRGIQVGGRGAWRIGVNDVEEYIAEAYRKTAEHITAGELKDAAPESDD
jgi:prophage regulatory protein